MKKILLILMIGCIGALACLPPIKPLPPLGCTYDNAMLIRNGNSCYWVYVNC